MWLQSKGAPDAADSGLAQPSSGRQHAAGPVRSSLRSLLQRQPHDLLDLLVTDLTRCSRTWLISRPATPSAMKRLRQRPTVKPVVRNFAATAALLAPPAHSRTIRARKATERALRDCRAMRSNSTFCNALTSNSCFLSEIVDLTVWARRCPSLT